jgi:hypothetical protein
VCHAVGAGQVGDLGPAVSSGQLPRRHLLHDVHDPCHLGTQVVVDRDQELSRPAGRHDRITVVPLGQPGTLVLVEVAVKVASQAKAPVEQSTGASPRVGLQSANGELVGLAGRVLERVAGR